MSKINIELNNLYFSLDINERITILSGDSGTGKSFLLQVLEAIKTNKTLGKFEEYIPEMNETVILDRDELLLINNNDDVVKLNNQKNYLIVLDRYDIYTKENKAKIKKIMSRCDNTWIVIARKPGIPNYGYSLESMVTLEHKKENGKILFYFKQRY